MSVTPSLPRRSKAALVASALAALLLAGVCHAGPAQAARPVLAAR